MTDVSPFRCPACQASPFRVEDGLTCQVCRRRYPIVDNMPFLVADLSAHEVAMAEALQVKPDWYHEEQPVEDVSLWRHHLKKRRLYVSACIRRELKRRGLVRASRLLDLGCGDGTNMVWLKEFTQLLYGSDYNAVRLARARARFPDAKLFLSDILEYPVIDGFFDVVYFNHVIEHIPDDEAALATVFRILAPGGLLVLGTPNEGVWWWQLAYKRAPEILKTTDHVHFYTAETISQKLEAAGFRVIEVKHMGWGPPDWHLDGRWRQHKWVDDLFEYFGRMLFPRQASSLYLLATK